MEKINRLGDKRIVLAIILVASITLIAFLALRSPAGDPAAECRLLTSEPSRDTGHLRNVPSEALDALATLSGDLELATTRGDSYFLPLELQRVTFERNATGNRLVLDTNCAQLLLELSLSHGVWSLNPIEVLPRLRTTSGRHGSTESDDDDEDQFYACKFPVNNMSFEPGEGLTCPERLSLRCPTPAGEHSMFLNTNLIRFELEGNPEEFSRGQYSRPSRECEPQEARG